MSKKLSTRAEGYLDLCILVIVFVMLVTLSLSICRIFTERIEMQQAADKILEEAVKTGLIKSSQLDKLVKWYYDNNGYEIEITKDADDEEDWVQFGESIYVSVRKKTFLEGLGKLLKNEEFSLEVTKDAKSERYWKW